MKTSPLGISALVQHEGIVPAPYYDSVGVLTYGIGHTSAAGSPNPKDLPKGMPEDLDAALYDVFEVFEEDLAKYEAAVDKAITVPVEQHEFDAAVSFHYNTGAIASATWVKTLNSGNKDLAATQIMNWTKPAEIIPRRQAEQDLFKTGIYPTNNSNVWGVDSNSKLTWKVVKSITQDEVLEFMHVVEPSEVGDELVEVELDSLQDRLTDMKLSDLHLNHEFIGRIDSSRLPKEEEEELPWGYLSKNFKASEFACNHCGELPEGGIDGELVELLQELREHFDRPVNINSGYRCPVHNKNIGGVTTSQHLLGKASDISVSGVMPNEVYKWADKNNPEGGVGKYDSFTHIDTRNGKARW